MTKPRDIANLTNPGAISSAQLAANSVTTAKLASGAVTADVLANGSIINSKVSSTADIEAVKAVSLLPLNGADTRDLQEKLADSVSVKDFGAVGNGTNDDRFALNDCQGSAATYVLFPSGTYFLGGFYTFLKPVIFMPGARIKWGNSDVVTFNEPIIAGPHQIFEKGNSATIAVGEKVRECYPEWFGAVINNGNPTVTQANLAALKTCVDVFPITILQGADYFISGTLEITNGFRTIQGVYQGPSGDTKNGQTRILIQSGTADCIKIYTPNPTPGNFNSWNQRVTINDVQVARAQAPVIPASGDEINGPAGIRMESIIWVFLNRVTSAEHFAGYLLNGTIRVTMHQALSIRSVAGAGPNAATNDKTLHFWLNGYASFGLAGGNASTYMTDCTAGGFPPGKPNDTIGLYMPGAFVDTFTFRFECTKMGWGIYMDGSGLSPSQQRSGCADTHHIQPILDAITLGGIGIFNASPWAAINILSGYTATAGDSTPDCAGLRIHNSNGLVSVTNYQTICWPNVNTRGIYITNSNGVRTVGGMTHGAGKPIELVGSSRCSIEEGIVGHTGYNATQAAILLTDCSRNYIRPIIYGDANTIPIGVSLGGASVNNLNEVNCTNIDSSAITGGVPNVLRIDGTSVTTPGPVNTGVGRNNLASGLIG